MEPSAGALLLDNVAVVLVEPRYPENIGAAARCALNMGISRLVVVRDRMPEQDRMRKMATHEARHIIDSLSLYPTLQQALDGFGLVVGTTARHGRHRGSSILTPRTMASTILPFMAANRVALVFGPEHRGLTNNDIKYCHHLVRIPTADFSSLNLAQAVAICCYELRLAVIAPQQPKEHIPKIAMTREMEGMYSHLEEMLTEIGFLQDTNTDHWMRHIRAFLGRLALRSREVKLIRGFCRQLMWYAGPGQTVQDQPESGGQKAVEPEQSPPVSPG